MRPGECSAARARPSTRGSGLASCGASASRQRSSVERRAERARRCPRAPRAWTPDRRREHRHVARQRLEHRQPEALGVRGHEHGVGGVDRERHVLGCRRAEREQRHAAARTLERAVVALARPRGVGREEQAGPVARRGRARAARASRGIGAEALEVDAAGQHLRARAAAPPGSSCASACETAATRSIAAARRASAPACGDGARRCRGA